MPDKKLLLLLLTLFLFHCERKPNWKYEYLLPEQIVVDDYHGQKVEDPYRYMETLEDSTVFDWYDSLTAISESLLSSISGRDSLLAKITDQMSSSRSRFTRGHKFLNAGSLFYLKYEESFTLEKLYFKENLKDTSETLLFDPVDYKPDADEYYVIDYIEPSLDGSKVAISLSTTGQGISEMIVLDVQAKRVYPELITNCWPAELGGVNWLPNHTGFTYTYIPEVDPSSDGYLLNTESVLHTVGKKSVNDYSIFSKRSHPKLNITSSFFPIVKFEPSNNYCFGRLGGARDYDDYYVAAYTPNLKNLEWKRLYKPDDQIESFESHGDDFVYLSSKDASNFKICSTSLKALDFDNPKVLVEEDKNSIITDFAYTKAGIFFVRVKNGVEAKLFLRSSNGQINEITTPTESSSIELYSNHNQLWIESLGWKNNTPLRFAFDFETKAFREFGLVEPNVSSINLEDVVVKEVEVVSHDGVEVPLSLIYKKGVKLDRNNRVLLTAYGAYGNSFPPSWEAHLSHWVELGGVYAVAHVRGGGEKGDNWHKGGLKETKPNSWKDLIACTEYLIEREYTKPSRVAIWSTSAGGIVVGRAITERPSLFEVAIVKSGMLNPLRSEFGPNGPNNIPEYGTVEDPLEFKYLLEMDPFHHLKKGVEYPALYVTASENDGRVAVWSSGKFIAKMMTYAGHQNPIVFNVSKTGGHAGYTTISDYNLSVANDLSFALWRTGHPDFQLMPDSIQ